MKKILALAIACQMTSCASTTVLNSNPSGAKLYVDGLFVGQTPYTHTDTKIVGATTTIKLVKEGCTEVNTVLSRNEEFQVGPCIGGALVLVPFLWIMGYHPNHAYNLECGGKQSNLDQPQRELAAVFGPMDAKPLQSQCSRWQAI